MTDILEPWQIPKVRALLERYWELVHSSAGVSKSEALFNPASYDGFELAMTVAGWIERVDLGCRRWWPQRDWGGKPIVIRWLVARDRAQERGVIAENCQRDAMFMGIHKEAQESLSWLWRKAERASLEVHRIENSRNFQIQCGFLGVAFSMCAADDWTFRRLELRSPSTQ